MPSRALLQFRAWRIVKDIVKNTVEDGDVAYRDTPLGLVEYRRYDGWRLNGEKVTVQNAESCVLAELMRQEGMEW